ncbi:phage late control D family protein [Burkholderia thailandensis]|uniref:phage late control D family protein n=1 Tax=Burkholderia thailandensis TaxID=57975 RepID=UPI001EE33633|nr:phage late control D family protein [Burkholderia thailandensis]
MTLGPREPQGTAFAPIFEAMHRGLLQRERLLKLDTPLGANTLIPLRALGCAQLGRDYTWTIDAATTRDDLNPDALIAQPVTLWMQPPRMRARPECRLPADPRLRAYRAPTAA